MHKRFNFRHRVTDLERALLRDLEADTFIHQDNPNHWKNWCGCCEDLQARGFRSPDPHRMRKRDRHLHGKFRRDRRQMR